MNLRRWLRVIMMMGLILALNSLTVQADPYRYHGDGYGWEGPRHRGFDHHDRHFWRSCKGPHHPHYINQVYAPPVAYVAPVAPIIGIPYAQPQPYYSQPVPRGLSGTLQYNF